MAPTQLTRLKQECKVLQNLVGNYLQHVGTLHRNYIAKSPSPTTDDYHIANLSRLGVRQLNTHMEEVKRMKKAIEEFALGCTQYHDKVFEAGTIKMVFGREDSRPEEVIELLCSASYSSISSCVNVKAEDIADAKKEILSYAGIPDRGPFNCLLINSITGKSLTTSASMNSTITMIDEALEYTAIESAYLKIRADFTLMKEDFKNCEENAREFERDAGEGADELVISILSERIDEGKAIIDDITRRILSVVGMKPTWHETIDPFSKLKKEDMDELVKQMKAFKTEVTNFIYKVQGNIKKIAVKASKDEGGDGDRRDRRTRHPAHENAVKLVRVEVPEFSGNPRDFLRWRTSFQELVGDSEKPSIITARLRDALSGEARAAVANLTSPTDIFDRLESRFGRKGTLIRCVNDTITNMPSCRGGPSAIIKFMDTYLLAHEDLKAADCEAELMNEMSAGLLRSRLTYGLQEKLGAIDEENKTATPQQKLNYTLKFLREQRSVAETMQATPKLEKASPRKNTTALTQATITEDVDGSDTEGDREAVANIAVTRKGNKKDVQGGNTLGKTPTPNPSPAAKIKCPVDTCRFERSHPLQSCKAYKALTPEECLKVVMAKNRCQLCLTHHPGKECALAQMHKMRDGYSPACQNFLPHKQVCGKLHHHTLCGAKGVVNLGMILISTEEALTGTAIRSTLVLLIGQCIPYKNTEGIGYVNCLFDTGATTPMVLGTWAEDKGFHRTPVSIVVAGIGNIRTKYNTNYYTVPLLTKDGMVKVDALGMTEIAPDFEYISPDMYPGEIRMILSSRPTGPVELLLSMQQGIIFPRLSTIIEGMLLFDSSFEDHMGLSQIVGGQPSSHQVGVPIIERILFTGTFINLFNTSIQEAFWSTEAYGQTPLKSCNQCIKCKECSYRSRCVSVKEQKETNLIEKMMSYRDGHWEASYPLTKKPALMGNTRGMALQRMLSLERKLMREGRAEEFARLFQEDYLKRKVFRPVEELTPPPWTCHIPMDVVYKPDSLTTSARLVLDGRSQARDKLSLNQCLAKGMNAVNSLYDVLLRFRFDRYGGIGDLVKSYNSVYTNTRECACVQVMWRSPESWGKSLEEAPPHCYGLCKVMFGIKPSGAQLGLAIKLTARMFREEDPIAAEAFEQNFYVDESITTAPTREKLEDLIERCKSLAAKGGLMFKEFIITGQKADRELSDNKVLGLIWEAEKDLLHFIGKVNLSPKKRGARVEADLAEVLDSTKLTKRRCLRGLMELFDPLGLCTPFSVALKVGFRDIRSYGWDEDLSQEHHDLWISLIKQIQSLDVKFPRSVYSLHDIFDMLCACDGSSYAFACVIYIRYMLKKGTYASTLLTAKSRLAPPPESGMTIPRIELQGAVLLSRVLHSVLQALKGKRVGTVVKCCDSTSSLGIILKESLQKDSFDATRAAECRRLEAGIVEQGIQNPWFHIEGSSNPADSSSRGERDHAFLSSSEWQRGPHWFQTLPVEQWPITPAKEKLQKLDDREEEASNDYRDYVMLPAVVDQEDNYLEHIFKRNPTMLRIKRITASIMYFVNILRYPVKDKEVVGDFPVFTEEELDRALQFWVKKASAKLEDKRYRCLKAFRRDDILYMRGRALLDQGSQDYPILDPSHPFTKAFLLDTHNQTHEDSNMIVMRSRRQFFVPQARKIVKAIRARCNFCIKEAKKVSEPVMGDIDPMRRQPKQGSRPFSHCWLDLAGPFMVKDSVKKRTSMKVYTMVIRDGLFGCVYLDAMENASLDSFLVTLSRFFLRHGSADTIYTDRGTQIKAAAKELGIKAWGYDDRKLQDKMAAAGVKWTYSPVQGSWMNGLAESSVSLMKKFARQGLNLQEPTFSEFCTYLAKIQYTINARPLGGSRNVATEEGDITYITANDVIMGHTGKDPVPVMGIGNLTKRMKAIDEAHTRFWQLWSQSPAVWDSIQKTMKWNEDRSVELNHGDVVLHKIAASSKVDINKYKLALVEDVVLSENGKVYQVKIKYKPKGHHVYTYQMVPVRHVTKLENMSAYE